MRQAAWRAAGGVLLLLLAGGAAAHINMVAPMPLQYKSNPYAQHIDYDIKSPLSAAEYPCHGALGEFAGRGGTPVAAWAPGSAQTVRLEGSATHNGGSCQLALSYDAGATFTVLYSKIGGCPTDLDLPFTLPADAPAADRALLAWAWNNHSGNREFYMNCASVQILAGAPGTARNASDDDDGSSSSSSNSTTNQRREKEAAKTAEQGRKRRRYHQQEAASAALPNIPAHRHDGGVPFARRPRLLVVNLFNTTGSACVAEGHDVLYPQPGPDYDDVSTAAALPFDCGTGQVIPFGAPVPAVPASVVPDVSPVFTTSSGSSSSSTTTSSAGPAFSASTSSTAPYAGETSSSAAVPFSATSATATPATGSGGGGGGGLLTGPCTDEGVYNCIGGTEFQRCASGQWSAAEPMAPGTRCTPGLAPTISGRRRARRRAAGERPGGEKGGRGEGRGR